MYPPTNGVFPVCLVCWRGKQILCFSSLLLTSGSSFFFFFWLSETDQVEMLPCFSLRQMPSFALRSEGRKFMFSSATVVWFLFFLSCLRKDSPLFVSDPLPWSTDTPASRSRPDTGLCDAMRGPSQEVDWASRWFRRAVGDVPDSLSERSPGGFSSPSSDRCQRVIVWLWFAPLTPSPPSSHHCACVLCYGTYEDVAKGGAYCRLSFPCVKKMCVCVCVDEDTVV